MYVIIRTFKVYNLYLNVIFVLIFRISKKISKILNSFIFFLGIFSYETISENDNFFLIRN